MAQERSKGMKANPSFLPNGQPAPANDSGNFSDILQAEVERFAEGGDKWPSAQEVLESEPKSTSVAETKAKVDAQLRAAGVLDIPDAPNSAGSGKPSKDTGPNHPAAGTPGATQSKAADPAASGRLQHEASKHPIFSTGQPRYAFRDSPAGNARRPDPITGPIPETIPDPSATPRTEPDPLPSFFTRPRSEVSGAPSLSAPIQHTPQNAISASTGRFDPMPRSEPLLEDPVTKAAISSRRPGIGRGTLVAAIVVSLTAGGLLAIFSGNVAPNFVAAVADRFTTASIVPQNGGFNGESATAPTDTQTTATVPAPPVVRYDTLSSSDRVTVVRRSETTQQQAPTGQPSAGEQLIAALTPTTTINPPATAVAPPPAFEPEMPPSADPPPMAELAFALPKSDRIRLLERSQELLNIGDIVSARLFLERLIAAGDPAGAVAMAETFDPKTLERLPVFGMEPDLEQARFWYLRAEEMGATDVQVRLQALGN